MDIVQPLRRCHGILAKLSDCMLIPKRKKAQRRQRGMDIRNQVMNGADMDSMSAPDFGR